MDIFVVYGWKKFIWNGIAAYMVIANAFFAIIYFNEVLFCGKFMFKFDPSTVNSTVIFNYELLFT